MRVGAVQSGSWESVAALRAARQRGVHAATVADDCVHGTREPACDDPKPTAAGAPSVLGVAPGSVPFHTLLERLNARARIVRAGMPGSGGSGDESAEKSAAAGGEASSGAPGGEPAERSWPTLSEVPPSESTEFTRRIERVYRLDLPTHPGGRIEFTA